MNPWTILGAALLVAFIGYESYSYGVAQDRNRSDLVILKLQKEAGDKLAVANKLIKDQSDLLQSNKDAADKALQLERDRNKRRLADAVATSDLVRDQIDALARNAGSADNSLATCQREAQRIGGVLAYSLRAHGLCSDNAEAEASNARVLLEAWPTLKEPK